ncbi:MAG: LrgB family protein [Thermoflavifilum sp.]|nr:LrgB family protein [Thermoflavifilum sp.]MCL6512809.1 LrgB family protein [Alicyclobacillus sp.]
MLKLALWLCGTIAVYALCRRIYGWTRWALLSPVFSSMAVLCVLLWATRTPYTEYAAATHALSALLAPATVALALPLYRHTRLLRQHGLTIVASLIAGTLTALVTSVVFAQRLHLTAAITRSIAPRSVTTPVAMAIAGQVGGSPVLAAAFVTFTAFCGLWLGPLIIRRFRLRTALARGLLMGMGAHGIGTSRALEMGEAEGAAASLAMSLAAVITALIAPALIPRL